MALSHEELERRVERNTNDTEAIYDLLTDHTVQLGEIKAKLDAHDARFNSLEATLAEVLRRLPEPPAA